MKRNASKKLIIAKIGKENKEGFTVDFRNFTKITKGYSVGLEETQNSFGKKGIKKVIKIAQQQKCEAIGGWFNEKNGKYYFDAVKIFDNCEDAINFAKKNGQYAIYDLNNNKPIDIC